MYVRVRLLFDLSSSDVTDWRQGKSRHPWQAKCKNGPASADILIFNTLLVFSRMCLFAFFGAFSNLYLVQTSTTTAFTVIP